MTAPAGPAPSAQLRTPNELRTELRIGVGAIRDACNDGTLHAHRIRDIAKARWSIPLACALAWRAGRDEAAQAAICPLCTAVSTGLVQRRR